VSVCYPSYGEGSGAVNEYSLFWGPRGDAGHQRMMPAPGWKSPRRWFDSVPGSGRDRDILCEGSPPTCTGRSPHGADYWNLADRGRILPLRFIKRWAYQCDPI